MFDGNTFARDGVDQSESSLKCRLILLVCIYIGNGADLTVITANSHCQAAAIKRQPSSGSHQAAAIKHTARFGRGFVGMATERNAEEFNRTLAEGAWLLRANQPTEAMEKLLPLYEQAPTNVDVAINLGGAYILLAKWNKAVRVLSKAAELQPNNAMIWSNLGAAQLGRLELAGPQQQQRAIRAYERALAVDPTTPNVHYHLGLIYKERGELSQAIRHFEDELALNPLDQHARYWIERLVARAASEQEHATQRQAEGDSEEEA
jgi:tetratricopeptide (TPR) repeat protein